MDHTSGEAWLSIRYLTYRIHNRTHDVYGFETEGLSLPMEIVPKFWGYDGMANHIRPRMSIAEDVIDLLFRLYIRNAYNIKAFLIILASGSTNHRLGGFTDGVRYGVNGFISHLVPQLHTA